MLANVGSRSGASREGYNRYPTRVVCCAEEGTCTEEDTLGIFPWGSTVLSSTVVRGWAKAGLGWIQVLGRKQ